MCESYSRYIKSGIIVNVDDVDTAGSADVKAGRI